MEEGKTGEGVEIRVEGNEAGLGGDGLGGQPGIGPALRGKVGGIRPFREPGLRRGGFREEGDFWQGQKGAVGRPRLGGGERISAHDPGIGKKPEQPEHGNAAKEEPGGGFGFPIASGPPVELVIGIGQSQPDIQIGKVTLRHGHLPR